MLLEDFESFDILPQEDEDFELWNSSFPEHHVLDCFTIAVFKDKVVVIT